VTIFFCFLTLNINRNNACFTLTLKVLLSEKMYLGERLSEKQQHRTKKLRKKLIKERGNFTTETEKRKKLQLAIRMAE
jgi:hypothetical protein